MIQTKKYSIGGMDCDSCATSLKTLLEKQSGVRSADVSFKNKEAIVELDDAAFDFKEVEKAVGQTGHTMGEKSS